MVAKVLFVALLACAVAGVYGADVDVEAGAEATPVATDKKIIKPHMHPRGGLRRGHVKPFPVGYDARRYRADVHYARGGIAPTTEELLHAYPQVDTRKEIEIVGEGEYNWDTPEYASEYAARTGDSARRPRSRRGRKSIPVVHYKRGTHAIRRPRRGGRRASRGSLKHFGKARRANTPKAEKPNRVPRRPRAPRRRRHSRREGRRRGRRAGRRGAKKSVGGPHMGAGKFVPVKGSKGSKKSSRLSMADRVTRLEKTMTFVLRELGRHLGRVRKVEKFAAKGKRAITLIAKTLQQNQKHVAANTKQVDALRAATIKMSSNQKNLHERSKVMNALVKKHKKAIRTIAGEYAKSIRANKKARTAVAVNSAAVVTQAKIVGQVLEAQRKALKQDEARLKNDERHVRANEINTKALHTFAQNAQRAIVDLDTRLKATTKLANKEKQAFKLVFKLLNAQKSEISQVKNTAVQSKRKGTGH